MIVTINFWGKKNITSFIRVFCFPDGSAGKESTCNDGDLGSIPRWGRSPGEGNGNTLHYSCLGNPRTEWLQFSSVQSLSRVRLFVTP